jgi:Flp pilus assembly protein TadD
MGAGRIRGLTWLVVGVLLLGQSFSVYGAGKTAEDYLNQGKELLEAEKTDEAIAAFGAAIKLNPKSATAFNNRGIAFCKKGEFNKAIADFSKAIKIDPNFGKAYNNRAVTLWYQGKRDQAEKDIKKAESLGIKIDRKALEALSSPPSGKGDPAAAPLPGNKPQQLNPPSRKP